MPLKSLFTAVIILSAAQIFAAEPTIETRRTASNYYAYPYPELPLPALTPSPDGYVPFHMEHYGRHGSRWHIGDWVYREPINLLRPAERAGKLTPRGVELMAWLREIEMASRGRDGELTSLGADQHRGIAQRMAENFPEIFSGNARIDARSTDVVRCILSMDCELQELKAVNPRLDITSDASRSTLYYMNFNDTAASAAASRAMPAVDALRRSHAGSRKDFMSRIVSDPAFAADSIDGEALFQSLFRITANAQSHYEQEPPYDLFTDSELHNQWIADNARWFIQHGNTPLTGGLGPMRQRYLMRNIIESADTSLTRVNPGANLRFGHEVVVLPMAALMEIDSIGVAHDDLATLHRHWRNYEVFPMASNIQMIFYRPDRQGPVRADEVLVKVLLNEREVTLPATPMGGPYYRWTELRKHYLDRIGDSGRPEPATPF